MNSCVDKEWELTLLYGKSLAKVLSVMIIRKVTKNCCAVVSSYHPEHGWCFDNQWRCHCEKKTLFLEDGEWVMAEKEKALKLFGDHEQRMVEQEFLQMLKERKEEFTAYDVAKFYVNVERAHIEFPDHTNGFLEELFASDVIPEMMTHTELISIVKHNMW